MFSQSDCRPYMGSHTQSQLFCNGISVVQPLPNISNTSAICRLVNFSTNFVCGCICCLCRHCLILFAIRPPPFIVHLTNNIPRKNDKTKQSNIDTIFHLSFSCSFNARHCFNVMHPFAVLHCVCTGRKLYAVVFPPSARG